MVDVLLNFQCITVAILAQGTNWALAHLQAFSFFTETSLSCPAYVLHFPSTDTAALALEFQATFLRKGGTGGRGSGGKEGGMGGGDDWKTAWATGQKFGKNVGGGIGKRRGKATNKGDYRLSMGSGMDLSPMNVTLVHALRDHQ